MKTALQTTLHLNVLTKGLVAAMLTMSIAGPAFAQGASATGGPSGGPNQAQSVVPSGATGGQSGGPSQSQFVKKKSHKKRHDDH